ncbi:MAG: tetratricopeptide repeat protein [Steroidobacteraceae bacterium]
MLRKMTCLPVLALLILGSGTTLAAGSDPTVQQIYAAALSGQVARAEQLVSQMLADHPNSGKAHYVAAEVYARAGDFSTARRELARAEALEPGLPFAEPRSVQALQAELAQGRFVQRAQRLPYMPQVAPAVRPRTARPWGLILVLVAGIVIVLAIARRRHQALYPQYPAQTGMAGGVGPMGPMGTGGAVVPPYPYGYGTAPGPGLMSSVGTGLAMGAGVAAGEALVHRVISGSSAGGIIPAANAGGRVEPPVNGDMGGEDFGVSEPSSSDDGGGGDLGGDPGDPGGGDDFGAGGDGWT